MVTAVKINDPKNTAWLITDDNGKETVVYISHLRDTEEEALKVYAEVIEDIGE